MNDNVIDLSTGLPLPDPNQVPESAWVTDFIEHHLGDFMSAVNSLLNTSDEEEFKHYKAEVEQIVAAWPDD